MDEAIAPTSLQIVLYRHTLIHVEVEILHEQHGEVLSLLAPLDGDAVEAENLSDRCRTLQRE